MGISGISLYRASGFCSIHFTVTLAGLKNVNRYIGNLSYRRSLHRGSTVVYEVRKEDLHT